MENSFTGGKHTIAHTYHRSHLDCHSLTPVRYSLRGHPNAMPWSKVFILHDQEKPAGIPQKPYLLVSTGIYTYTYLDHVVCRVISMTTGASGGVSVHYLPLTMRCMSLGASTASFYRSMAFHLSLPSCHTLLQFTHISLPITVLLFSDTPLVLCLTPQSPPLHFHLRNYIAYDFLVTVNMGPYYWNKFWAASLSTHTCPINSW